MDTAIIVAIITSLTTIVGAIIVAIQSVTIKKIERNSRDNADSLNKQPIGSNQDTDMLNPNKLQEGLAKELIERIKKHKTLEQCCYNRFIEECKAIIIVAEKASKGNINEFRTILRKMNRCKDAREFVKLEQEFHGLIYTISEKNIIFGWENEFNVDLRFSDTYWETVISKSELRIEVLRFNEKIVDAVEAKDKDMAINAMQIHFSFMLYTLIHIAVEST